MWLDSKELGYNLKGRSVSKIIVKLEDLAVLTIPLDAEQNFTLRISCFPTGSLRVEIGRTF